MLSILIIIIGLSFLVIVHELGHFLVAKFFKLKIDEFGFGLPPRAWGKRVGETIYSLNWLPFGGYVKIYGEEGGENSTMSERPGEVAVSSPDYARSFAAQSAWKRSLIIVSGVVMNFLAGWLLISVALMIGTPAGVIITDVRDNSPAKIAGLMPGDKVSDFKTSAEFTVFIQAHKGEEVIFNVKRGDQKLNFKITPRTNPPQGEGALGVGLTDGGERSGFLESVKDGFLTTGYIIGAVFVGLFILLKSIFIGQANFSGIVGPVGIFGIAAQTGSLGLVYLLHLLALISINLGVVNIIPFPALDGGRFLFILLEKIKGSPLPVRFERAINSAGFVLLLLLMLAITMRDVGRLL